ncbi:GNAT family N-acetyltransferase [Nonomuraea sp. NPDC050643]|uniref:GNAT family N-acetyltransferase n=1 Tax=Nonomuraea sp. NPDC050643 TaxID=3155660 RepID=UPI00340CB090
MGAPDIRQAVHADLPALVRSLGQKAYFTDRLTRQETGHGFLLVAWEAGVAVGDVYVWLAPAEEPELRALLPGVALLTHLEVVSWRRNEGIGSLLLQAAEQRLAAIHHTKVALGVGLDNLDAQRLYRRRGYVEWRHGPVATTDVVYHANGRHELRPELCRILIKPLHRDHRGPAPSKD